jgi:Formin Homology 2 Domain
VTFERYASKLPYEEIESLFGAAVIEEKPKDTGAKKNVSVLDSRRAQNVGMYLDFVSKYCFSRFIITIFSFTGILLTKFKCTNDELKEAILTMNESVLDLETMNQLIKYIPTTDEVGSSFYYYFPY